MNTSITQSSCLGTELGNVNICLYAFKGRHESLQAWKQCLLTQTRMLINARSAGERTTELVLEEFIIKLQEKDKEILMGNEAGEMIKSAKAEWLESPYHLYIDC